MEYVKVPVQDISLITCIIDVMEAIAPAQYKEQVHEAYQKLHNGKYEILNC